MSLWTTLSLASLQAQSDRNEKLNRLYKDAAKDFHLLFEDTPFRRLEENWLKTIRKFEGVYRNYPKSIRAIQSYYNIGKLYRSLYRWNRKRKYINLSNDSFTILYNKYPDSYLADDSLYELAVNAEELQKDKENATLYYRKLVEEFPSSEYQDEARSKLPKARNKKPLVEDNKGGGGFMEDDGDAIPDDFRVLDANSSDTGGTSEVPEGKKSFIGKVAHWSTDAWTRVVINSRYKVRYSYNTLEDPKKNETRFYINLLDSFIDNTVKRNIAANDGIIRTLRVSQFDPQTVRVVLDLDRYSDIRIFGYELPRQYKLVIDVFGTKDRKPSANNITSLQPKNPAVGSTSNKDLTLQKVLGLKINRIIIDPGHGGKDPGAVRNGKREKDIVLKFSLLLKKLIETEMDGMEVILTREKDIYLELEGRTAFANKNKGDLFISVHVNAHKDVNPSGIETYFLNLTQDKDSLNLAAIENSGSLRNVSDLQSILNDLIINSKLQESSSFADNLQKNMVSSIRQLAGVKVKDRGVKQAPFVVLLGANMPSVLLEIGFLSNANERRRLTSNKYLTSIAHGVIDGIKSYLQNINNVKLANN